MSKGTFSECDLQAENHVVLAHASLSPFENVLVLENVEPDFTLVSDRIHNLNAHWSRRTYRSHK